MNARHARYKINNQIREAKEQIANTQKQREVLLYAKGRLEALGKEQMSELPREELVTIARMWEVAQEKVRAE